jgi:hypothetical protein
MFFCDNDSEMQKQMEIIKDRIEKEFPTALGLKSNEEKTSENIQKINEANLEKSKLKASEIEKQKEALRKEQEDFEAEKAKYANDIEEMQMLIELTQDTLKDNPNDEDLPLYLELLNDTLQGILTGQKDLLSKKKTNKTAFANGGELVINDTDIASDNEISSLLLKIEKDWGKDSDYYSTIEGIIVGYSKSDSDGDMYLNANGIKRINEELANFDFKYRLTSNGIVDIEELEEDTNNLYVYKFHEERGEVKASVEDMTTGITVWEYNYPDYSLDEDEREFQSSIVEDGFMKNFDDVEGLENYLKSLQILPMDAELISEEDAIQDYQYYANGGSIFSNSNHNTGRSWHLDRQRYNSNEDWEKPLRKRKRKYKNGGSVVDNDIIYAYKQIEKEKQRILSGLTVPYKESFGDVNINVEDVFTENGSEELKYENVGYGGIRFMGNINGKVPTQGLYYKDSQTKNKIQNVIRALDQNNEDKRSIVDDIIKQKGKPKQQLSVLNMIAKRLENGGIADDKTHEYRVMYSYKSRDGVDTDSFQDEESARNFYNEKIKEDDIELVMFDYNEYNRFNKISNHKHIAAYSWKDKKFASGGEITIKDVDEWDVINDWATESEKHPKYNVSYAQIVNDINDIGAINDLDDLESYKKEWKERYNLKSTDNESIEELANDLWRDILEAARKDNAFENYVKILNKEREKRLLDIPENYIFIRHDRNVGGGDYFFKHRATNKELKLPDWHITEMGGVGGTDLGYVSREGALKKYFSKNKYSEGGGVNDENEIEAKAIEYLTAKPVERHHHEVNYIVYQRPKNNNWYRIPIKEVYETIENHNESLKIQSRLPKSFAKMANGGGVGDKYILQKMRKYQEQGLIEITRSGILGNDFKTKDNRLLVVDSGHKIGGLNSYNITIDGKKTEGHTLSDAYKLTVDFIENNYSNGGGVDEIKVGDIVNLSEIKMPNGEIQYERVDNGVVKYISEGIYGIENPKTRRIHQVRKEQIEGYENYGGVDYEKHYSSSPINEQSFGKLKSMLNNSGFSHYKNTPENQLKHGNRGDIAIIGKSSVIVSHYTPNTNRFLDSKTFETEIELAKFLDKNDFYKDGGNVYPIEDARKPVLNSGVILLVKDTKEEADKYVVGNPDLFVAPIGDKWAIKKFENGGEMSSTPMYKKGDEVVLFSNRYNPNADVFLVDEYIKFDLGAKQHYYKLKNKNSGEFYERYESAIIPVSDLQKDLSTEEKTKLEAIYEKYHNIDYWGYGDTLKSQLNSWRNAYAKGDKGALKYTEQDIIDNMWMREKMDFDKIVNSVRDMVSKKDLAMMISRLRYDQKVSLEIYEVLTGEKIKGMSNKELSQYFTSKYGS